MPNLAIGYTREGAKMGEFKNNAYTGVLMKGSPAGGGYSTVEDLLKFGQALQSHKDTRSRARWIWEGMPGMRMALSTGWWKDIGWLATVAVLRELARTWISTSIWGTPSSYCRARTRGLCW